MKTGNTSAKERLLKDGNMGVVDTGVRAPSSPPLRTCSGSFTILSIFARVVAWYLLYTVLFVCPDIPTNGSPTICHTAHTVSMTLRPHLEPYYNQYLGPYVTEYSPWVKKANEDYLVPTYDKVTDSYKQYAAPHVSCTRDYVEGIYRVIFIPVYEKALPHAVKAYEQVKHVVLAILAPMVRANGEKAVYWGIGIWSDVVRPQVGRIGERLSGAGNGTPAVSVPCCSPFSSMTNSDVSKAATASSSLDSFISSTFAKAMSSASPSAASQAEHPASADGAKKLTIEEVHAIIEEDLASHAQKSKDSAIKTAGDLNLQIDEISIKAKGEKVSYVTKEIAALEKLVEKEFSNIKKATLRITSRLTPESDVKEKQAALDSLSISTKEAGLKIRDKAQEQRLESQRYLATIYDDVAAAADNHLEIFGSVLDLSMQELGMKWASMDHVSYKEWRRYHAMKKDFEGLKREVVTAAQRNQKLIEITRWVEGEWEGAATDIAKKAAEELKRLKKVSKKKIELADSSDHFPDSISEQKLMRKVEKVKEAVVQEVKRKEILEEVADKVSTVIGTRQPSIENIASIVGEKVGSDASAAWEKTYGTETNTFGKAITANEDAFLGKEEPTTMSCSIASATKAHVPGGVHAGFVGTSRIEYEQDTDEETLAGGVSIIIDAGKDRLADASHAVSEALVGATTTQTAGGRYAPIASEKYDSALSALYEALQPVGEPIVSIATDKYSAAVAAASSIIYGTPTPKIELLTSQAWEVYEHSQRIAKDEYCKAIRKVETMVYPNDLPHKDSAASVAKEAYNEALKVAEVQYSSLLKEASRIQTQYNNKLSEAQMYYESAIEAASTAVYGAQPAVESVINVAKKRYQQGAQKTHDSWYNIASTAISPPPTTTYKVTSSKSFKKADNAASAASSVAYDTPQVFTWPIASVAGEYTSAVTNSAVDRYESVKAFVSELISGKEPAYTESVMSRISSLMYGTDAPILCQATSVAGEAYESASSIISENYEFATSAVESLMTPPPALESIISAANEQVQAAIITASEQVYGTTQGTAESIISVIGGAYESGSSQLSKAIYECKTGAFESATMKMQQVAESAQGAISEAVYGTLKGTPESATNAFAECVDTATSVISENLAAVTEAVAEGIGAAGSAIGESYEQAQVNTSTAIYDPQQDVESAQSRVSEAVESAKSLLSKVIYGTQTRYAEQVASSASSTASMVSLMAEERVESTTEKVKEGYSTVRDEL